MQSYAYVPQTRICYTQDLRLCTTDSYLLHAELCSCPAESYLLCTEFKVFIKQIQKELWRTFSQLWESFYLCEKENLRCSFAIWLS